MYYRALSPSLSLCISLHKYIKANDVNKCEYISGESYRSRHLLGLNDTTIVDNIHNITEWTTSTVTESIDITKHEVPKNCTQAAILELPSDGFTRAERQRGWVIVHLLLACYCFWLLATICDDYFVPAIETMCSCKYYVDFFSFFPFLFYSRYGD